MSRDETRFILPDSFVRQKPDWTQEVPQHIAEFLARGGKITQLKNGESFYAKHYADGGRHKFVINPAKPRAI